VTIALNVKNQDLYSQLFIQETTCHQAHCDKTIWSRVAKRNHQSFPTIQ